MPSRDRNNVCDNVNVCDREYSHSNNKNYDHSDCHHQYVVGYGDACGVTTATVSWDDPPPTTESECVAAHMTLAVYYNNRNGYLKYTRQHGVWMNMSCEFKHDRESTDPGDRVLNDVPAGTWHILAASAYSLYNNTDLVYHARRRPALVKQWLSMNVSRR